MSRENPAPKQEMELRRGVLVLAVLSRLHQPLYGYSLRQALADEGMPIEEGTLYPLLRRLEGQGLLESEWRIDGSQPRRYYWLSPAGKRLFEDLSASWRALVVTVDRLLGQKPTPAAQRKMRGAK